MSRQRPRLTWPADMRTVLRGWRWGRPRQVPNGAQAPDDGPTRRPRRVQRPGLGLWWLRQRLVVDLAGTDAVAAIDAPVVVVANHPSVLDLTILRAALPRGWRVAPGDKEAALAAGRSVIVFPEGDASHDGKLGEFSMEAAELANHYNVPLVPVAIRGTYNLKALLRLRSLKQRPLVQLRFGRPISARSRSLGDVTGAVRDAIADLLGADEVTWWGVQRRSGLAHIPELQDMAPWRRAWAQSAPHRGTARREPVKIWVDPDHR